MKNLAIIFFIMLSGHLFAQVQMTIYGDSADSSVIKKKRRLEDKGFQVAIKSQTDDNPLLSMGDQGFRSKHKGKRLANIELKTTDGKSVSSEELRGKLVHINFWSTTCGPCIKEFLELNELKKKYADKGWTFLAMAPENLDKVSRVMVKHSLDYSVIPDAKEYYELLGINGYPKDFFIDKTGTVVEVTDGTHFVLDAVTKEMKPDNFRYYDQIMPPIK